MAHGSSNSRAFTDLVLDRLIADHHGDETWADLMLAACNGADALNAALDGHAAPRPAREGTQETAAVPEPPGAYLRSITVEGFRGIGPAATLNLTPGPGLTLVVGRNGSGKSSFAEGLEVLLTGGNKRWDGRSAVWKDGWRCLHRPNPCAVRAEFAVEAMGTVTVERHWDEAARLDASRPGSSQRAAATTLRGAGLAHRHPHPSSVAAVHRARRRVRQARPRSTTRWWRCWGSGSSTSSRRPCRTPAKCAGPSSRPRTID